MADESSHGLDVFLCLPLHCRVRRHLHCKSSHHHLLLHLVLTQLPQDTFLYGVVSFIDTYLTRSHQLTETRSYRSSHIPSHSVPMCLPTNFSRSQRRSSLPTEPESFHRLVSPKHLSPSLNSRRAHANKITVFIGWLIDQISARRLVLLSGLSIIAAATLILELSSSIPLYFLGRVFQGAAATIVWSSSLAWLLEKVGHDEFPRHMGYAIMSQSIALAISPPIGGFLFDLLGYDAVFIICLGLIFTVVVTSLLVPGNGQQQKEEDPESVSHIANKNGVEETVRRIDSQSTIDSDAAPEETSPLIPHIEQPASNNGSWYSTFYILTSPQILVDLWSLASVTFLWSAFAAILPLRMKLLFDSDAFGSGSVTLPLVIPTFLAPLAVKASNKFGSKWVAALLLGIRIPAAALLSLVSQDDTTDLVMFFILLTILGKCRVCSSI